MTGFFSGFSKLDGIEARMVGRTCTIKEGIKMAQSADLDFLHERFAITVDQPQNFTLRCRNGTSVVDTKYTVEGSRVVNLPVMCYMSL